MKFHNCHHAMLHISKNYQAGPYKVINHQAGPSVTELNGLQSQKNENVDSQIVLKIKLWVLFSKV